MAKKNESLIGDHGVTTNHDVIGNSVIGISILLIILLIVCGVFALVYA